MESCCCCYPFRRIRTPKKVVLLLVGLDNAGKTTAAKGLAGDFLDDAIPTVGFSSVNLKHRGYDVKIYDLGGGPQIRDLWKSYFQDVHGVIFVMDASDLLRIEECKSTLENLLRNEKLAGKPVLVLANKQDRPGALDELDIVEQLRLEPLVNEQKCVTLVEVCSTFQPTSGNTRIDSRLLSGYRWLLNQIIHDYNNLNERVEEDVKIEMEKINAQKAEWRKRMNEENQANGDDVVKAQQTIKIGSGTKKVVVNGSTSLAHREGTDLTDYAKFGAPSSSGASAAKAPINITSHIREQFEQKGIKQRHKLTMSRRNKVFPWVGCGGQTGQSPPGSRGDPSLYKPANTVSLTLQALTSPARQGRSRHPHGKCLPPLKIHHPPVRPSSSKSLGSEGRAWGLDEDLEVVYPSRVTRSDRLEHLHEEDGKSKKNSA